MQLQQGEVEGSGFPEDEEGCSFVFHVYNRTASCTSEGNRLTFLGESNAAFDRRWNRRAASSCYY